MENKWQKDLLSLAIPPLPKRWECESGCILVKAAFDEEIGPEVFLAVLEEPSWCLPLAVARPFNIFCKSGIAETEHGTIIFAVWTVAAGSPVQTVHEQFLNPNKIETIRLLSALAQQTHLKVLVINSRASEVINWFEFENEFGFDKVLMSAIAAISHDDCADFDEAIRAFQDQYSVQDLLNAGQ